MQVRKQRPLGQSEAAKAKVCLARNLIAGVWGDSGCNCHL